MNHKYVWKRILAIILSISLIAGTLTGCSKESKKGIIRNNAQESSAGSVSQKEEIIFNANEVLQDDEVEAADTPEEWEEYVGDIETFVYGLLSRELGVCYDVFPASVQLLDGIIVSGIGYTDYSECYTTDDEEKYYFEAGFLPYFGELDVPQEDFDSGIELLNEDYVNSKYSFILANQSESFREHCVVYGQYLQYGVDDSGKIFYEAADYQKEKCDESLGALYSYDEGKYLFDPNVGKFLGITGISLSSQLDYVELEREINRILENQDTNFVAVDVQSCAYIAQEAVSSYLLSMQQESFLGYDVKTLVEEAEKLDPRECYQFTEEGLVTLDMTGGASTLTKWLVGTGCAIVIAVAMVGSMVTIECPPLSAASSAMAGTAIEIFMQVVVSGEDLEDINWNKVVLAAATGAVSGFLGPYVYATTEGISYFTLDSSLDGFVGGIEKSVTAWMEGENAEDIIKSFGYGFALGFAMSAGFKGVGAVVGKLANKIGNSVQELSEKIAPKLTAKTSAILSGAGEGIYKYKEIADKSVFHSKYISQKISYRQLAQLSEKGSDKLLKESLDRLSKKDFVDDSGNLISEEMRWQLAKQADNGSTIGYIKKGEDMVSVVKQNGMVGIVFDSDQYQTVTLPHLLSENRNDNFDEAASLLKEAWLKDPSLIPEPIDLAIKNSGVNLEDMKSNKLVSIIRKRENGWVLHENIDMQTITLVPRKIHDIVEGGVSHAGGIALKKYIQSHMGMVFFERFVSAAATIAVQAQH